MCLEFDEHTTLTLHILYLHKKLLRTKGWLVPHQADRSFEGQEALHASLPVFGVSQSPVGAKEGEKAEATGSGPREHVARQDCPGGGLSGLSRL